MQDTAIRGKAAFFLLFVLMIVFSIHFQRQEFAAAGGHNAAGAGVESQDVSGQNESQTPGMQSGGQTPGGQSEGQTPGGQSEGQAPGGQSEGQMSGMQSGDQSTGGQEGGQELPSRIALTFDDGPHPVCTKLLLNGLRERGVKATFFVIGENIPGREELIAQMAKDGHMIGNHTYNHVDISTLGREEACEELQRTCDLVEEITGSPTAYVRAPFGKWDDGLDACLTMIPVKWTIDPMDWATKNQSEIVDRVVEKAGDNDIILLHDCYESSVKAALQIVDILLERGFVFVTVEDLLLE